MVNWNSYLDKICDKYAEWWTYYTFTDVEGRKQVKAKSPLLDFMMVETLQPAKEELSQKHEKTERLVALEGLRKYAKEHVLLIGRPGSGKSTALVRLLLEEAEKCRKTVEHASREVQERQKIPVLVELRRCHSVLASIRSFFMQNELLLEEEDIKRLLVSNQLLLLIDGLNELPSEAARQDLISFRGENATTPMIFTTRDLNLGGDLGIAKKLEMQPLTERQMRDFVKSYLPEQGDRLLQKLSARLREFGQTPLLLMMLCSVYAYTDDVPSNLGLVFHQFTKYYDLRRLQDVLLPDELRRWWQRLLEHLAWEMTQGREPTELQVAIPKREAEEIFTEFLQQVFDRPRDLAMTWLEYSLKHHLIQLGAEDKIEFRHQLIQEYYTARRLLDKLPKLDNDKLKREYLNYLKWTEPLALMLELEPQDEQALRVVKLALEVDLRLAARLAGAAKPKLQEKTVALIAGIDIAQEIKVELLGMTRSSSAIALLIQALDDEDDDVRSSAAEALKNIRNKPVVSALVQVLNHENNYVRWSAAKALGKLGDEAAVPPLTQALNDKDEDVRLSATEALGEIGNETAVNALMQVVLHHQDADVRSIAAEALGKIGHEVAVNPLVQALNDKNEDVRSRATEALGIIGSEAAVNVLVQALNHEYSDVRLRAAVGLGTIGNDVSLAALVQAFNHQDSGVCSRAAEASGIIGNEAAVPALIKILDNEYSYVRWRAAKALGIIGSEAAVPALLQALNDEDSNVRWCAAEALGKMGNEAAVASLIQALDDEDEEVRWQVAVALGKIANPELLNHLFEILQTNGESYLLNTISAIQERCKYYNYTLTQLETSPTHQSNIPRSQSLSTSVRHILHLSDLHFGTLDNARNWYSQIADDLIQELDRPHLNALVLSGDIANKSTPEEYAAAKQFLDKLCQEFCIQQEQIVIVPGNHDLNWGLAKKAYGLMERQEYEGELQEGCYIPVSEDVIRVRDENKYKQRFANFSNFYKAVKGKEYPTDCDRQYTLDCINDLLILGLNSAWQLDHHYKSRASIKLEALSNAINEIRNNPEYKNCQKIAVWHHPLDSGFEDRIKESNFLERLAVNGFRIFLHGHVHQAQKGFYEYDAERGFYRICAGTFGAATRELPTATPWQYHLLKFEADKVTIRSRKRQSQTGAWESDTCWRQGKGKPALDRYEIQLVAE